MTRFPRSECEARARSERKLKAVERHLRKHLLEIAVFWDEGQVTGQIDLTLENLRTDIGAIRECMDEEIRVHEEMDV
ncbi:MULTISPECIES: hypothetical protein [unclassified Phaeobacter]|uniref:hypothetical protein n=1 Tax=unclassified Phaeobacter TaxID=2621772 RepID=UPI003A864D08